MELSSEMAAQWTLLKYKSCICVNGKEQAFGSDYWETYAPVVDDCLIFSQMDSVVDALITTLSKSFLLQDEGDVNAFLVQIQKDAAMKTIMLRQPHLIQQSLNELGIQGTSNSKETPVHAILHKDGDCAPCVDSWNH